jgi:hypothetical protein
MPPTATLLRSALRPKSDRRGGGGAFSLPSPRRRPFSRRRIFDCRGCFHDTFSRHLSTRRRHISRASEPETPLPVFPLKLHDTLRHLLTPNDTFSPCFLGFLRNPLQRFAKGAKLRISRALGLKRPWKEAALGAGSRRFKSSRPDLT